MNKQEAIDKIGKERLTKYLRRWGMNKCEKCNTTLVRGKALKQNMSGSPDFIGGEVVTMSADGTANLINCLKCPSCGKSYEIKGVKDD